MNARNAVLLSYMAYYHAMLNEEEQARRSATLTLALDQQSPEILCNLALTYCQMGDTDQALDWLGKAVEAGLSRANVRDTPLFDRLKSSAKFQKLLKDN